MWLKQKPIRKLHRVVQVLGTIFFLIACSNVSVAANQSTHASDLCIVPVKNGTPSKKDLGSVHRMISHVSTIPNLGQVYIQPWNRGGRWTVSKEGEFKPFKGIFPKRILPHSEWVVDSDNRVIGRHKYDLFALIPPNDEFQHLLKLSKNVHGPSTSLRFDEHSETVFLTTAKDVFEIRGDQLIRTSMAKEASKLGIGRIFPPYPAPSLGVHIIEARSGAFFLRSANGKWHEVYKLNWPRQSYYETLVSIDELTKEQLIIVKTTHELFAVDVSDPNAPKIALKFFANGRIDQAPIRMSRETGAYIIYEAQVFKKLTESGKFPSLRDDGSWFLTVVKDGVRQVKGHKITPHSVLSGDDPIYHTRFIDLPGRGQALIYSADGLAIFDGETVKAIPKSGPETLGKFVMVHVLIGLNKVVISARSGIYELTNENMLHELDTPFDSKNFNQVGIEDVPKIDGAIFFTESGVYALDKYGDFRAIPGGNNVKPGPSAGVLSILPQAGDVLISGSKAIHLITSRLCP